ncbi:MAG: hypothetical protein K2P93_05365 [Alphaproteobacteria bacterium]|nr:hypothetical protein [Alphaproteobacteria bacterium]
MKNILLTLVFFLMIQNACADKQVQPAKDEKALAENCANSRNACKSAWTQADQETKKKFATLHACQQTCLNALKACNDSRKHAKRANDTKEKADALENFNSANGYNMDCQRMLQERGNSDGKSDGA